MNMRAARNVACLLPFFLTGCSLFHKHQNPPVQVLAPNPDLPKPVAEHPELSASTNSINDRPLKTDSTDVALPTTKPPAHKRKQPKPVPQQAVALPPPAVSAAPPAEPPSVSAIGQLSTGGGSSASAGDLRRETDDSLSATERSLNTLNRALSDQEQKTATQIREYLKQAREALLSNDVDGASTLAAKAKVLLGELQPQ